MKIRIPPECVPGSRSPLRQTDRYTGNKNDMQTPQTASTPIRLAIYDAQTLVRDALSRHLQAEPEFHVLSANGNLDATIETCRSIAPDVLILTESRASLDLHEAAAAIRARQNATRFLFLACDLSDIAIEQALRAGAHGYLLKNEPYAFLKSALLRIHQGEFCFSRSVENRIHYNQDRRGYALRSAGSLSGLTDRQLEVLKHLAVGRSVRDVARRMQLTEKSVDSHKYRIMNKLGVHDRVELALLAVREGLVRP